MIFLPLKETKVEQMQFVQLSLIRSIGEQNNFSYFPILSSGTDVIKTFLPKSCTSAQCLTNVR